jgi:hypothetical protein
MHKSHKQSPARPELVCLDRLGWTIITFYGATADLQLFRRSRSPAQWHPKDSDSSQNLWTRKNGICAINFIPRTPVPFNAGSHIITRRLGPGAEGKGLLHQLSGAQGELLVPLPVPGCLSLLLRLQVMCRTSTPDTKVCDQCKRHGLECIYLEHRRGRKLGSRNKRTGASGDDSGSPPAPVAGSSRTVYPTLPPPEMQRNAMESQEISRQPITNVTQNAAPEAFNAHPGQPILPMLVPPAYSPTAVEVKWRASSPNQNLPEQSPLALLARTAEAQSNNSRCG